MIDREVFSSELTLCLIGGRTDEALADEIGRVIEFIERNPHTLLKDIAYTAALTTRKMPCVIGVIAVSTEDLCARLKPARMKILGGNARVRDKTGTYYFRNRLRPEGKIAFIYPGASSYHSEMLREHVLQFAFFRRAFDVLEAALMDVCGVSPTNLIYPMNRSGTEADRPAVRSILAMAGTVVANEVFSKILRRIGVVPDGTAGVEIGAFSAAVNGGCMEEMPVQKRTQLLRELGRMTASLTDRKDVPTVVVLSVDKLPIAEVERIADEYPGRVVVSQRMSGEYTVVCAAPEIQEVLVETFKSSGATVLIQSIDCPFNTPWSGKVLPVITQFMSHWLRRPNQIPVYSTVTAESVVPGAGEPGGWVADQMVQVVRFRETILRMYDDGYRIFTEVGARGTLSMLVSQILGDRPHLSVAVNRFHRHGLLQMCHAAAQLAAHGVPIDLTQMENFSGATLLDFDSTADMRPGEESRIVFDSQLPRLDFSGFCCGLKDCVCSTESPSEGGSSVVGGASQSRNEKRFGLEYPLLDGVAVAEAEPGVSIELHKTILLSDYPFLRDYALGTSRLSYVNPQLRGLTLFSVPGSLEIMAETAQRLVPGLIVKQIESVKTLYWLSFEQDQLNLSIRAERTAWDVSGEVAVKVQLRELSPNSEFTWPTAEAVFVLAPRCEPGGVFQPDPLSHPRTVNWSGRTIYPDRLFQGPLLRTVQHVNSWSEDGIDYEVQVPNLAQTVRYTATPVFSCMPILMDGVISGFPLWRSHERFEDAVSFPFKARSIRFYDAELREGMRLRCYLRLVNVTPRSLTVDIVVSDGNGHKILQIKGWEEYSFHVPRRLHDFVMHPGEHYITDPMPTELLPPSSVVVTGAIVADYSVPFYTGNRELWLKTLAMTVLSPSERDEWYEMRGAAPRRLEWLLGRTTAKEAVRRHLAVRKGDKWAAADITIWPDDSGKPHPLGPWRGERAGSLDLTIAHTASLVIAAVAENARLGIDIERMGRDLSEEFTRGVFTIEEQELATRYSDPPSAMLRFWCAKEAVSKALGTGIRYSPTDLRIRSADPLSGIVEMELIGQWLDPFPAFKGKRIPVKVGFFANHAVAACILPGMGN